MITEELDFRTLPTPLNMRHIDESSSTVQYDNSARFTNDNYRNTTMTNTNDTAHDYGPVIITMLSVTMVICMVLSFFGNTLVILTVVRHKGMKTRTNMFIVNLAVADVLVAIFNMPFSLITVIQGQWIFGDAFCQFNGFLVPLFFIVSIHTLMYISIHKYISITKPFSRTMTPRKILIMIAASWFWAALCATTTLKGGNHVVYKKGSTQCGPSIPDELNEYIHSIMITTCNYILPLVVMSYCYYNIFREIHEHMTRIRETSNVDLENSLAQQRRISSTLFLVLACFLICWTPFIVYSCSAAFSKDKKKIPLLANPLAYWCGYMNSACNPIIYALRSPSFRQGYKEIMCSYNGYNIGGSIVTRPSLSPHGTLRKSPSRMNTIVNTERLVKNIQKKNSESADGSRIIERRRRKYKTKVRVPHLVLKPNLNDDFSKTDITLDIQAKIRSLCKTLAITPFSERHAHNIGLRRVMSLNDVTSSNSKTEKLVMRKSSSLRFHDHHFLLEVSRNQNSAEENGTWSRNLVAEDSTHSLGSCSTIGRGTDDENSADELSPGCPLVVIDEASLHSSAFYDYQERKLSNASSALPELKESSFATLNEIPVRGICDEGKWSPISTKSLEMGRSRKNSSKLINEYMRITMNEGIFVRKSKDKLDSPFYTASKEQLMRWMSQDFLDKIERGNIHRPVPFHALRRKWLSIKRKSKSVSTSFD